MTHKIPKLLDMVYKAFIDLMFYPNQPVDLLDNYVVEDVMGYGTALDEKIFDLKGMKNLAILQREHSPVLKFKYELLPVYRKMMEKDRMAILVDEIKINMIIEREEVIMNVRLSMIWQMIEGNWKLLHWHGSKAEYDSGGTDTWHMEEWQKRNEELQKQVEEKAAELIQKNRELEIESALERVRTTAMSMQKPDDILDVCKIISDQLELLNISNIRNIQVAIIDEAKKNYLNYQYFTPYSKKVFEVTEYANNPESQGMVSEMQKSANTFYKGSIKGKALKEFREWRIKYNQFPDPLLDKTSAVYYYFYSIGNGGLGLTTYKAINNKELAIFKRFHKVFELAYRRFHDIEKAEAQAREALIELALERVRARTMAMHKSEELSETASILFQELQSLEKIPDRLGIVTYDEENKVFHNWLTDQTGMQVTNALIASKDEPTTFNKIFRVWQKNKESLIIELTGNELEEWLQYVKKKMKLYLDESHIRDRRIHYVAFFSYGFLMCTFHESLKNNFINLFIRFAKVFEQTYTRFLDLKKSEAQARESEIQLALERVRARTMAMQKSEELAETMHLLSEQLKGLGEEIDQISIGVFDEEKGIIETSASIKGSQFKTLQVSIDEPFVMGKIYQAWKKKEKSTIIEISDDELLRYNKWRNKFLGKKIYPTDQKNGTWVVNAATFSKGLLSFSDEKHASPETLQLLERFAAVFDLTYTRFLDLKNAEAQAQEAQIQLAMERVRSRSMAMHKSEELAETAKVLFEQFDLLGKIPDRMSIGIINEESNNFEIWETDQSGKDLSNEFSFSLDESTSVSKIYKAWLKKEDAIVVDLTGQKLKNWIKFVKENVKLPIDISNIKGRRVQQAAFFSQGFLLITTHEPVGDEMMKLLIRFARVFDHTYTRFLDLKKAEAQARDAQIEAALERVRSKTMAMHNSEDMAITVTTLFEEVLKLGLDDDIRCGIGILEGTERMETRSATLFPNGEVDLKIGMLDMKIHPLLKRIKNGWERGEKHYVDQMSGNDVFKYYTALNNEPDYPFQRDLNTLPDTEYHNSFSFQEGIIFAFSPNPMSAEAAKVFERFARVFGQTYRRYRDLQKAEAQAREAQIEAALERVRAKAMAMHSSDDLAMVVDSFFSELTSLNIAPHRCGMGIIDPETRIVNIQSTTTNDKNKTKKVTAQLTLAGHPVLDGIFENWKLQKEYHPVLHGREIADYYNAMNPEVEFPAFDEDEVQYGYYFYFEEGGVYAWTNSELKECDLQIFRRYTSVLSLTLRRYFDLKEAEVQTREAVKQASLDRIRGQIASMRNTEDLQQLTPLVWRELKTLEVPFFRCGIFIVDEKKKHVNVYLTAPDGKPLGSLDLAFSATDLTKNTVEYWRKKEVYQQHWNKAEFIAWTQEMMKLGQIKVPEKYQGAETPPESLHLHFIPFAQGMLYVGNQKKLGDEKIDLVKSLAEAFSFAYARYQDFAVLEEAKEKVEKALSDLKATQSQLVHAEKMASLGELTAGIAHEIQNPLNFVNNFSEVSADLIEELKEELENGDAEEVNAIATDLLQNLEKINHHGKRASGIVKSMLEHSRAGSGEKQLTDINAMADEYLRLAYHGLRAKDKSFNADFKLEADENLPEVNLHGQDIGRVLLNLINNAFFAVNEKVKEGLNDYRPLVVVRTKLLNNKVNIRVQDNGNGIPDLIKEKIFQPFFTTKPTGQGTGLGLSLSYDIVTKGHGGKLEVKTKEGEGTTFIIIIPMLNI